MNMEANTRLSEALGTLKIKQVEAAEKLGVTPSNLSQILKGNRVLGKNMIKRIEMTLSISSDWLLTGEGDMLRRAEAKPISEETDDVRLIPLLPISAQAGSLSYFTQSVQLKDCEMIVSPIKGADYAMRVSGDSMSPEYPNGSQVLIKKIDPKMFMDWGRVFVLDTYNGTVMKQVAPGSQPDRVRCISKNPDPIYAPFEVMWDDVIGVYRVLMCMSMK